MEYYSTPFPAYWLLTRSALAERLNNLYSRNEEVVTSIIFCHLQLPQIR